MISVTQIHFVEEHWEAIARRALTRIRNEVVHSQALTDQMILDRSHELFGHLGDWLAGPDPVQLSAPYEQIGRARAREAIFLHELVRCMQILRQSAVDYVRENELHEHPVLLRSEEELEYRIDRFFDYVIYQTVKGYEGALREKVHTAAGIR
jgi:hypothetical protein